MKKRAFTLVEIMICVVLSFVVLGVVYKVFSGTFQQFFKSSNKMTNLRAASLILERLKADVRAAVIPVDDEQKPSIETGKISFYKSDADGNRGRVTYSFSENTLKREAQGENTRNINSAKVKDFNIEESPEGEGNRYIKVMITVDNEKDVESRSNSSKANQVELTAILYPRFYEESLTDEERFWNKTREML